MRGDADAPVAVVAAGRRWGSSSRARRRRARRAAGWRWAGCAWASCRALRRSLAGAREVTVLESLPGELGDDGLLTLLTSRALGGGVPLRAWVRGAEADATRYEDPAALDLELMPLEVRRRLDLAGAHMSLAAWQAMELVSRAALCRFPVDEDDDLADFARAARDAAAAVGHALRERPALARPWDLPEAFSAVRTRASALGFAVEVISWAALREPQRFALAHLAAPKRPDETFGAALLATGLVAP
ncbi:MAG: nitrate reductase associated protein [Polyangiales bacterium]